MGLVLSSHVRHRGKRNPLRAWHNELGMPMPIWQALQTSSGTGIRHTGLQASGKRQRERGSTTSWSSRRCAAGPSPRTSVVQRGLGAAGPLPPVALRSQERASPSSLDGKHSTKGSAKPQQNTQKHVFLGLTKNTCFGVNTE